MRNTPRQKNKRLTKPRIIATRFVGTYMSNNRHVTNVMRLVHYARGKKEAETQKKSAPAAYGSGEPRRRTSSAIPPRALGEQEQTQKRTDATEHINGEVNHLGGGWGGGAHALALASAGLAATSRSLPVSVGAASVGRGLPSRRWAESLREGQVTITAGVQRRTKNVVQARILFSGCFFSASRETIAFS